jgi:hypothetical protein
MFSYVKGREALNQLEIVLDFNPRSKNGLNLNSISKKTISHSAINEIRTLKLCDP